MSPEPEHKRLYDIRLEEFQANVAKESLAYRIYSLEVVTKAMLNPLSCKDIENPEQSFLLASPIW